MRSFIERSIFSILFVFVCATLFAQPYKKLTANDFKGEPTLDNEEEIAFTSCSIAYSYQAKQEDKYYLLTFTIRLSLNHDQSWIDQNRLTGKKSAAQILDHEQGHYNIAYLEQQELLTTVSHTVFYDDYGPAANKIFTTIDAKYRQLNHDYDIETQNSTNIPKQRKWDAWFQKKLNGASGNSPSSNPIALGRASKDIPVEQDTNKWLLLAFLPGLAYKNS
jgi:hypothetical protein